MITNYSFYLRGVINRIASISLIGRGKKKKVLLQINDVQMRFPSKEDATEYLKRKIGDAFQFLRCKREVIRF